MPHPFLFLITDNLALDGFLGWWWSLWLLPTWLALHWSKAVFFLTLYYSINGMKQFSTVWIKPHSCHSHFFVVDGCQFGPMLYVCTENGAYGLCRLVWGYNGVKLFFNWPYMILSMIWNNSEMSASHLSRATAIFVVDCCQFGPSWMFGLKMELMACASFG